MGGAERYWKAIKRIKNCKREMLGTEKVMKLATISATCGYEMPRTRRLEAKQAGKLWEDNDFENQNNFCSKSMLEMPLIAARIFSAWEEG